MRFEIRYFFLEVGLSPKGLTKLKKKVSRNTFLFDGISSINFLADSTLYYSRYWRVFLDGFKPHYSQLWQYLMMVGFDLAGAGSGKYQTHV